LQDLLQRRINRGALFWRGDLGAAGEHEHTGYREQTSEFCAFPDKSHFSIPILV
jgi:hypothetical protein